MNENPYASPESISESTPILGAMDQKEAWRSQTLAAVRMPALGILLTSSIGMAIFTWTLGTILYARLDIFRGPDGLAGSPDFSDLNYLLLLFAFYLLIAFPVCFFGSLLMLHGKRRQWAVATCILCLIPGAAPGFPLSFLIALQALSRLRRPEVVEAFEMLRIGRLATRHMRLEQLFWPASVLLFLATLMSILMALPWVAALVFHYQGKPEMLEFQLAMTARPLGWLWPLISYASMMTIGIASVQMLRGKTYSLCLAGASLALIPLLTPCVIMGIPFGIWAAVVLWDKNTRAAFAHEPTLSPERQ